MASSRHDWKIVDWDVKPQHNQPIFCRLLDDAFPHKLLNIFHNIWFGKLELMEEETWISFD